MKCVFGFTPDPECDNCGGMGIFSEDDNGQPQEPCHFCVEQAIRRGEVDGCIEEVGTEKDKITVRCHLLRVLTLAAQESVIIATALKMGLLPVLEQVASRGHELHDPELDRLLDLLGM